MPPKPVRFAGPGARGNGRARENRPNNANFNYRGHHHHPPAAAAAAPPLRNHFRPSDIDIRAASDDSQGYQEGDQLTIVLTNGRWVYLDHFQAVTENEVLTPNTARIFNRYELRSLDKQLPVSVWRKLLAPLLRKMPMPALLIYTIDQHFSTPEDHRPSKILRFSTLTIDDLVDHRERTSCFVCAALCDKIIQKRAEAGNRPPSSPEPRYVPMISQNMAGFLHACPKLSQYITKLSEACMKKDITTLKKLFTRPNEVNDTVFWTALQKELKTTCPKDNEGLLRQCLAGVDLVGWLSIAPVALDYLRLVRDWATKQEELNDRQLKKMTDSAIVALGDPTNGSLILPVVLDYSRFLALVVCKSSSRAAAAARATNNSSEAGQLLIKHAKFLEECANSLREAFIRCLVGGSSGSAAHSTAPDGKRTGIYITANSCLRLLFKCGKLRNAQQMFVSIDAQSPYLDFYPRAQRIAYLYYLGAYHFANNHFHRAHLTLHAAYNLTHRQDLPHRRLILIHLIAANICLGRFPSTILLSRPEAIDLAPHFLPLCKIIAQGDLGAFHNYLDLSSSSAASSQVPSAHWLHHHRLLLQLRNRAELLVWRALIRKTFRYSGHQPAGDRMVPFLRLPFVQAAARFSLRHAAAARKGSEKRTLNKQGSFSFMTQQQPTPPAEAEEEESYTDPDLHGIDAAINETGFDVDSGTYDDSLIGQHSHSVFSASHLAPYASSSSSAFPPGEALAAVEDAEASFPTLAEIESIFSSLIHQGLLRGFLTHGERPRFAVPGAGPHGGALVYGFPCVWRVIVEREGEGEGVQVPGWVRREDSSSGRGGGVGGMGGRVFGGGGGGGGRVVNLSGARPAGAGP